ncbi:cytochrome P450 [Mycena sp. CBHHK59/15]|nr:cytochrome P450 [Mycena sp. CBHHK59/15]
MPAALLLPWLPSPTQRAKERAMKELYTMLYAYVDARCCAPPSSDTIDALLAEGMPTDSIIGMSGIEQPPPPGINRESPVTTRTSTNAHECWILLYLGTSPPWKARPLHMRAALIPAYAWEDTLPIADTVIRETLHLTMGGVTLRRNRLHDVVIGAQTIPCGMFLGYPLMDVCLDPQIYADPLKFDPRRYVAGRAEDKGAPLAYLDCRCPCAAKRVTQLEMKLVLELLLFGFEYDVVDAAGRPVGALLQPDRNDLQMERPLHSCNVSFKRVVD